MVGSKLWIGKTTLDDILNFEVPVPVTVGHSLSDMLKDLSFLQVLGQQGNLSYMDEHTFCVALVFLQQS